jgi:hypothetical protein
MLRIVASKIAWAGRTASMVFGLALIVTLLFGVTSMAFARDGGSFLLGARNVAQSVSTLVKQGAGPALSLQVDSGSPLAVNSSTKVANLNADKLDGKNSSGFVRGNATTSHAKVDIPAGTSATIISISNPDLRVPYVCPSSPQTANGIVFSTTVAQSP